jgi:hypothetical protein
MKTATELRDELYEMNVLAGRLAKYSKKELETLIDGVKDQSSRIGEEVRRVTEHHKQKETGTIIRIEGDRGQVQWSDKKTWYKLDKLTPVSTTGTKKPELTQDQRIWEMYQKSK